MASNYIESTTSKNEECVLFYNYKYYKKGEPNKDGSQRYVCSMKKCSSSITIANDDITKINGKKIFIDNLNELFVKSSALNNHDGLTDADLIGEEFTKNLKSRVSKEPNLSIQEIYQEEQSQLIKKVKDLKLVANALPQYYQVQSGLYKHKNKSIPLIPKTRRELVIEGEWSLCEDESRFLLQYDEDIVIFCSDNGLKSLSETNRWQADGTFSTAPPEWYQFYTIHSVINLQVIPSAFILLPSKDTDTYKKMIRMLKEGALKVITKTISLLLIRLLYKNNFQIGLELRPTIIMIDFEMSAINAFKFHFPSARILCCFFHFGQSLFRHIVSCGLKEEYTKDCVLKTWVRKVTAIALVPLDEVENVFLELLCEKPSYDAIETWADYVLHTYIERSEDSCQPFFDKKLWNQFDNDGKRTNNDLEGYNYKLTKFLKQHPNIWSFIAKIKSEKSTGNV